MVRSSCGFLTNRATEGQKDPQAAAAQRPAELPHWALRGDLPGLKPHPGPGTPPSAVQTSLAVAPREKKRRTPHNNSGDLNL